MIEPSHNESDYVYVDPEIEQIRRSRLLTFIARVGLICSATAWGALVLVVLILGVGLVAIGLPL